MGYMASCNGNIEFCDYEKAQEFVSYAKNRICYSFYVHDCDTIVVICGTECYHENFWAEILDKYKNLICSGTIEFFGEDNTFWRFVVRNGNWHKERGQITWTPVQ